MQRHAAIELGVPDRHRGLRGDDVERVAIGGLDVPRVEPRFDAEHAQQALVVPQRQCHEGVHVLRAEIALEHVRPRRPSLLVDVRGAEAHPLRLERQVLERALELEDRRLVHVDPHVVRDRLETELAALEERDLRAVVRHHGAHGVHHRAQHRARSSVEVVWREISSSASSSLSRRSFCSINVLRERAAANWRRTCRRKTISSWP